MSVQKRIEEELWSRSKGEGAVVNALRDGRQLIPQDKRAKPSRACCGVRRTCGTQLIHACRVFRVLEVLRVLIEVRPVWSAKQGGTGQVAPCIHMKVSRVVGYQVCLGK